VKNEQKMKNNIYHSKIKTDSSAVVELILTLYCFIGVVASIYFLELAALPFQLMFFFGFGFVSVLSIKQNLIKKALSKLGK
ncbi:MAG: hypothetical protein KAQ90_01370, partial [Melioribacteraceae bacterium]|nr:hypothetical protein [Melioribacteraceae bacterium]